MTAQPVTPPSPVIDLTKVPEHVLDELAQMRVDGEALQWQLIDSGRASEAARNAGCRTPGEITNWIRRYAPAHAANP